VSESVPEYYRNAADIKQGSLPSKRSSPGSVSSNENDPDEAVHEPKSFRADAFRLRLPNAHWEDGTTYSLSGPTLDGTSHSITITTNPETDAETPSELADRELARIRSELTHCRVLEREVVHLDSGHPACRLLVFWRQGEKMTFYQEQWYVVSEGWGYILMASFTRDTKEEIGDDVRRIMQSFRPVDVSETKRSETQ